MFVAVLTAALLFQNPQTQPPVAHAARRQSAVDVDGRIDEPAWQTAQPVTAFLQQDPHEGAPAMQRTEVRFLYDDDALYIAARMFDSAPVTSNLARRDAETNSDGLTVELDTYHDRLHSASFTINPSSVRSDELDGDDSWDPVWDAVAHTDAQGWTAEMRIPLSQLHFSHDTLQIWGMQLTRVTQRTHETDLWSFFSKKDAGGPAFYGTLEGITIVHRPSHLEVMPYAEAQVAREGSGDVGDPFNSPHHADLRVGGDIRYGVTSSLTLDATVNPDFGQVEADPASVNLSAYETYFSEKRPFFVQNSNLFDFGQPGCNINCGFGLYLFYSRRIGRPPQAADLAYNAGPFVHVPENTTILGAAKLTGRTAKGTSVGIIDALSAREDADVVTAGNARVKQAVQPLANAFIGRVTQEYRNGDVVIGAIGTSSYRDVSDPQLAQLLDRDAEIAGADAQLYWGKRAYSWYVAVAGSHVGGDSSAIGILQRSSARYLQRPDRTSYNYDVGATGMSGYGFITRIEKRAGNWLWDANAATYSPTFEANDLGFVSQVDQRWINGSFGRQWTKPNRVFRSTTTMVGSERYWDFDGDMTSGDFSVFTNTQFANYWNGSLGIMRGLANANPTLTRGGPVVFRAAGWLLLGNFSTDERNRIVLSAGTQLQNNDDEAYSYSVNGGVSLRPASNVQISLSPSWQKSRTTDQYITSFADASAPTSFYGRRYMFSNVDQTVVAMTTRADVTFTPSLSLQLFAQPFVASGHFYDFEEFARPRAVTKLVYGRDMPAPSVSIPNPDFNFRSLRGTGVLRWEYRPGSTLYFVWQQERSGQESFGDFSFSRDVNGVFSAKPDNIFLVKVAYWFGS